jgi:hypothetical protein
LNGIPGLQQNQMREIQKVLKSLPVFDATVIEKGEKVELKLKRLGIFGENLYCPYFPKPQSETVWIALKTEERMELKRIMIQRKEITVELNKGSSIHVFVDGYIGLDFEKKK